MLKDSELPVRHAPEQRRSVDSRTSRPDGRISSSKRVILVCGLFVLLAAGLFFGWHRLKPAQSAAQVNARGQAGRAGGGPVSVVAGNVLSQDIPIYIDGLGTVQAFNTVTVRARVDGQIQKIAFSEGQEVKTGDLLAEIDPAPYQALLDQSQARKTQDEAQLAVARINLKRNSDLLQDKILAQQDFDTQQALVQQLQAAVQADQAAVENATVQLGYTKILSPIDGRVGIRMIDQGNIIHANDSNGLVVITQLRPISVVFTVAEQNLRQIQEHSHAGEVSVLAVDRDNRTQLGEGTLAVVDNQIDTSTGTIRLKGTFPNDDLRLWPGQFVNARLLLTVRRGVMVVPSQVVQRGPDGPYVFVIREDSTVEVRPVQVAQSEQGKTIVEEGLKPGERVVVDGQYKLQRGSKVKVDDPSAGRPSTSSRPAKARPATL